MSTDAQIIPFPPRRQASCFNCGWFDGERCTLHDEFIDSELYAAANCDDYDPID